MMAKVRSRRLVIDASVARSAGGVPATDPRSKACREFLLTVLAVCHQVVMTPAIAEEWRSNRSSFARKWRVQMDARKKVFRAPDHENEALLRQCEAAFPAGASLAAALKDLHLIGAALATDRAVVSLDETARRLFSILARSGPCISAVTWLNPEKPEDEVLSWLEEGASDERHRRLGGGSS